MTIAAIEGDGTSLRKLCYACTVMTKLYVTLIRQLGDDVGEIKVRGYDIYLHTQY